MQHQRISSINGTASAGLPSYLSTSDQACNECKRRKGRCDRQLPECGPCARNKRHCLYERQGKTPLTRKYLQEVEARLRQTEWRALEAERRANEAEAALMQTVNPEPSQEPLADATPLIQTVSSMSEGSVLENDTSEWQYVPSNELEVPPGGAEDFSWDEHSYQDMKNARFNSTPYDPADPDLDKSMASLTVEDRGAGYLGASSGAAMLKLMLPDDQHRRTPSKSVDDANADQFRTAESIIEQGWVPTPVFVQRRIGEIDVDRAINAYFEMYHLSYPILHEPTFRAQYAQVLPRPSGRTWNALAYMVAAIGAFTTAKDLNARDLDLYEAAKANLSIDSLETGNVTLVQVLALMSNYVQKRNKPNSAYSYLGLALHTAMGLGLHKEFRDWQITPLQHETRRRIWWNVHNFGIGATVTFGRPVSWPTHGVEVALPLNVEDKDLTNVSSTLPPPRVGFTTHSLVSAQARFHLATADIYARVISSQFPTAAEMLRADDERIEPWRKLWAREDEIVPSQFEFARATMVWRYRNFRIIMYRPFLLREVLKHRNRALNEAAQTAIQRCMHEAKTSIYTVRDFWVREERNCMKAWYCMYFLFQASMIPCICLRNDPHAETSSDWRQQIVVVLQLLTEMQALAPAARECHQVICRLCDGYLKISGSSTTTLSPGQQRPTEESPATQINHVYNMMWPTANSAELDAFIPDDSWTAFLNDFGTNTPSSTIYGDSEFQWN